MAEQKVTYPYDGEDIIQCKGCSQDIFFLKTRNGRKMPVNYTGNPEEQVCHFATCPNANDFKSKQTKLNEMQYSKKKKK